jgi:murein L,D-transpeptidase YafK
LKPISADVRGKMENLGLRKEDPILVRIFKEEAELEVWKYSRSLNKYKLLKTWDICAFSGELGPKIREGDRQSPEGFYAISPSLMNPKSSYHLSYNTGFPNEFDRAHGRTGSHLMVHGSCSSRGCYAMTDEGIEEIYALAREAFNGGQKSFWTHAFPFRMTQENMEKHKDSEHFAFWQTLKPGYDFVETTGQVPNVRICNKQYVVNPIFENARYHKDNVDLYATGPCPAFEQPEPEQYVSLLRQKVALAATLPNFTPRAVSVPANPVGQTVATQTPNAQAPDVQQAAPQTSTPAPQASTTSATTPETTTGRGAISRRWQY